MEPRPKINSEMELDAAKTVAAKMGVADIDGTAESICAEYLYPMDGFELAKKLDRYQSWDTSREDMELLDELDLHVSRSLRKAEKEWFERNNVKPPHPIGSRVKWRTITGVVEGIYEHGHGQYLVKPDISTIGDGRYIVNFEDVQLTTEAQSTPA